MLELLGSSLFSIWLEMAKVQIQPLEALSLLAWQGSSSLILVPDPSPAGAITVQEYLHGLITSKLIDQNLMSSQGIWLQSGPMLMANHQGTIPLPAASLTKVATSLVALKAWGPDHQFETLVSSTGPIVNGVVRGDLVITGSGDPMFVSQEAIALGKTLNQMGIKQVKGNLVITGNFAMNFQRHPFLAGQLLKQILNHQVNITGNIKVETQPKAGQTLLVRHFSLPLQKLIKEMNVFSNNDIAEMLADSVGGADVVSTAAAQVARFPKSEILLINGSGLGKENRISPRGVCAMFMALQREASSYQLTLADLFPTFGLDNRGTIHSRHMPRATVIKTGTLNDVSALAGVVPTRDRGLVWFTIINRGGNVSAFRVQQDKLLQHLEKELEVATDIPDTLTPHLDNSLPNFGAANRNEILYKN
ncbi:D-alanyl-D-alanine carboxypeptidase [Aphanizomenon flos-aquae NRERC-008]|uniref:D-alanyl-D-alanine carboxypeptidase n=1 Tax=Aphanizomenon flos-aquae FACHB-1249 TaxID=2692889 RepID=A0ABR8IQ01_APHFL|nr:MULTISPECIES: D-alanyl-D-alanine carboxypeptidase [Aphanizomenon]MBD2392511.1 D-alanyl-D-alanine carboxypeptidase [Aphanizomenon flos-aquae FACHB-1171]MBD2558761.1 D-alanyl-D-alanine carboxypeptidase [Aphanizomenon flos-aquae FACHB-1290]MBD2632371.1 D-alanyl-D-alanine carboxypeptidase [Aphanizomenon sp. FACHB-1399]MBD2643168.1 D-alanyl-D-alanine carboxypeptidase [Aphanizomenon sp. FACHB-1401]MBD2659198.1 D-alanyl-D-alanine carboxypeptidase [Aphanizomenon flos-aquae FACHB-1265]